MGRDSSRWQQIGSRGLDCHMHKSLYAHRQLGSLLATRERTGMLPSDLSVLLPEARSRSWRGPFGSHYQAAFADHAPNLRHEM
jgi:hypothetical protein